LLPDINDSRYRFDLLHLSVVDKALERGLPSFSKKPHATDNSYRTLREGVYELFVSGMCLKKDP
jgi:hypothetical protein